MKTLLRILIVVCLLTSTQTLAAQCADTKDPVDKDGTLYNRQWHLTGYGEDKYFKGNTTATTIDINVKPVWNERDSKGQYLRGQGTYIAIVEGDVKLDHEDLCRNISTQHSVDYSPGRNVSIEHGTRIAGIAAARGYNGIGVRGVAPWAKIISLSALVLPTKERIVAMVHRNEITAVYNNSWGRDRLVKRGEMLFRAIETGISSGFYGKGSVYVFAAGNSYRGSNANYFDLGNYHAMIAVCAVNYQGIHNARSEVGSNLWVCAPSIDDTDDFHRYYGIVTTEADIIFTQPRQYRDGYTKGSGGTSSSTPMVSGVVALMRQANPNLSWRDVKLILAASASKNDPNDIGWQRVREIPCTVRFPPDPCSPLKWTQSVIDSHQKVGWQQGGVQYGTFNEQYHFNHKYGFGLVNAHEAVKLAENWVNVPERVEDTIVRDDHASTATRIARIITRSIDVQSDIDFIEHVDATIGFSVVRISRLSLKLKSPSGSISYLTIPISSFGSNTKSWRFGSSVHLGEPASGTWELMAERVEEVRGPRLLVSLKGWELRIRGFKVELDAVADGDLSYVSVNDTPLKLSLSGAKWKKGLQPSDFSLKNAPSGLSITEVRRTSDTQVQLKLAFSGTLDDKYDFQVQANIGTVTNLSRALVSNDIEIARVALKTTTIPQSTVGTQYHYTMKNAFASPTSLTYIIKLVDEEGNVLDTQIPGLTIDGHTISGIPETVGTHRLRVEATRTIDKATRTEYFVFSVEPHTIEVQLRVFLEGLQPPNPN